MTEVRSSLFVDSKPDSETRELNWLSLQRLKRDNTSKNTTCRHTYVERLKQDKGVLYKDLHINAKSHTCKINTNYVQQSVQRTNTPVNITN